MGAMRRVVLVTGGGRSGKSGQALRLASSYGRKAFIATALAGDDEMLERIARHRRDRPASFVTIEEPADLAGAVRSVPPGTEVAVIDCLTVWLGNLMCAPDAPGEEFPQVDEFLALIEDPPCDLIVVTNEVGMGIIPANALARRFRDAAGRLNQQVARRADAVVLMVSGIPLYLKGSAE
jgi:adenosylcobinamide kinase/adenosylcobinamide-phosphate guanylyltransferase